MNELLIPALFFAAWTAFSLIFIYRYKKHQTGRAKNQHRFWSNNYIFDSIAPVFPTLGILCTALGITIGIWDFNTADIQQSIPQLLNGLKLAFIATMLGIIGLIVFQKVTAVVQKWIDDHPGRPKKQTDELSAISQLTLAVDEMKTENRQHFERLSIALADELEKRVNGQLKLVEAAIQQLQQKSTEGLAKMDASSIETGRQVLAQLQGLREEQKQLGDKANNNTTDIIKAMGANNELTAKKFDEFSILLQKNNTEALVEVMKRATEEFNGQMSALIDRLVKENFAELNNSVKNLNDWQKENKAQVQRLTEQFIKTVEMFEISAATLKQVAENTRSLTDDDSKLSQIVQELRRVMIEDGKFQEMAQKLSATVETLENTTEAFDETTAKLNDWVKTERSFKEAAQILISKLEEFRDFNGDVWQKYRAEMGAAVSIIKQTSKSISDDVANLNAEFYERLNDTLQNLDECIQRFVPNRRP